MQMLFNIYLADIQLFVLNITNDRKCHLRRNFFTTGLSKTATRSFQSIR
jgi:hypothetical protein